MARIASGLSLFVDPFRRQEFRHTIGRHANFPMTAMNDGMVVRAKKATIRQARRTIVRPVNNMMSFRPTRWPITPRERTSSVAQLNCPTDSRWEQPACSADIKHLRRRAEHRGDHRRIARQHPQHPGADRATEIQAPRSDTPAQFIQTNGDRDVRALPTLDRCRPLVQEPAQCLDQGLTPPARRRARIGHRPAGRTRSSSRRNVTAVNAGTAVAVGRCTCRAGRIAARPPSITTVGRVRSRSTARVCISAGCRRFPIRCIDCSASLARVCSSAVSRRVPRHQATCPRHATISRRATIPCRAPIPRRDTAIGTAGGAGFGQRIDCLRHDLDTQIIELTMKPSHPGSRVPHSQEQLDPVGPVLIRFLIPTDHPDDRAGKRSERFRLRQHPVLHQML